MCMFCRSFFVILSFFFWPLCCLSFFDLRILNTPLVSSNSSSKKYHGCQAGIVRWGFVSFLNRKIAHKKKCKNFIKLSRWKLQDQIMWFFTSFMSIFISIKFGVRYHKKYFLHLRLKCCSERFLKWLIIFVTIHVLNKQILCFMCMFCRSLFVPLYFFPFGHCVVCSSIYGFWLPPFDIFKLFLYRHWTLVCDILLLSKYKCEHNTASQQQM
jgi:hypothetical protein